MANNDDRGSAVGPLITATEKVARDGSGVYALVTAGAAGSCTAT